MKQLILTFICIQLFCLSSCRQPTNEVEALAFQEDKKEQWGIIATDGTILVTSHTFSQQPSTVVNGMFTLPDGKGSLRLYHIDQPNQPVSPRRFARIGHFFEEVTLAQETPESPLLIIDKEGRNIASLHQYPQYEIALAYNFSEGRALIATREGKYGYMDIHGKIVIPPSYDCAYDFKEGKALVGMTNKEGKTGYQVIDRNGDLIFAIQLSNCLLDKQFGDDRLIFKELKTGNCGYLNTTGTPIVYLPENIKEVYSFRFDMAVIQTRTGTGVIDSKGAILIPANYEEIRTAGNERLFLKVAGKWRIADRSENILNENSYDSIRSVHTDGAAIVYEKGKYRLTNSLGKPIGNHAYGLITLDKTASREEIQRFIRTTPTEQTTTPAFDPQSISQQHRDTSRNTVQHTTHWKETSKQSPFYAEASKIINGKLTEQDAENRKIILNYVEHLRSSYMTKDIDFLEQLFSENALIIVGKVIHTHTEQKVGYLSPSQINFNVKSKREYLNRLKTVFKANKSIQIKFSDFRIMRHPTTEGLYGVSLQQKYTSDLYSDEGYLFLLWDFRDETMPKIHVRTWQPSMLDAHTPLPEESIFDIRNFNIQ